MNISRESSFTYTFILVLNIPYLVLVYIYTIGYIYTPRVYVRYI